MFAVILVLGFVAVLAVMSARAARTMSPDLRLPMQWGFDGRPRWRAPRNLALSFTPCLAALILIPTALASHLGPLESAEARLYFGVLTGMGVAWIGAHALYLWLVARWRRAEGV